MASLNIGATAVAELASLENSSLTTQKAVYSVSALDTDGATQADETYYQNSKWSQWFAYYKKIPELKQAIDAKARWTLGRGYKADPITTLILDRVNGWGKDTFNTIMENMIKVMNVAGDAFAEIILDDNGFLLNLKPLDPSSIKIVADSKGIIKRYEQVSKVKDNPNKIFQPEELLHLAKDRIADEIHGVGIVESVEEIILMRNEAMKDWRRVLHRNVDPLFIFHLDTDDDQRIKTFKGQMDSVRATGENIYVPKGAVVPEIVATASQAGLNPLQWIDNLNAYFYSSVGVPDIILGSSKVLTEASAKIAYLAFEQTIEEDQLYIEEQILIQLNLVIELEFPASLENEMLSSQPKMEEPVVQPPELQSQPLAQPNETQAGMMGRT